MHTKEAYSNIRKQLLRWFPDEFGIDQWSMLQYNEGIRYLCDRYSDKELYTMERSKLFWVWWKQKWEIVDRNFLAACQLGCFEKSNPFTLEYYKTEQDKATYFMPRQLERLILKQPRISSNEQINSSTSTSPFRMVE